MSFRSAFERRLPLNLFQLHYEGDEDTDDTDDSDDSDDGSGNGNPNPPTPKVGDKKPDGKLYTQAQIDALITQRTAKARKAQKAALEQLEQMQTNLRMTDEQREALEIEIDTLRRQTLTANELAKREADKAKKEYEQRVSGAENAAKTWQQKYTNLKIGYEIHTAAAKHGVQPQSLPFLEAFLRPQVKLAEDKDENGQVRGDIAVVDFNDQGADGKAIVVQFNVDQTLKRMKELPDTYGHLFLSNSGGGVGGSSGKPNNQGGKNGFRVGMSQEEYMRLRKENPSALYNSK